MAPAPVNQGVPVVAGTAVINSHTVCVGKEHDGECSSSEAASSSSEAGLCQEKKIQPGIHITGEFQI